MSETTSEEPWAVRVANQVAELTKTNRITWGGKGDWRSYRVVARKELTLTNSADETMVLKEGEAAWLGREDDLATTAYTIVACSDSSYMAEVPAQSVTVQEPGWQVPDHTSAPIELLCFELFPYAALRAELIPAGSFFGGLAYRDAQRRERDTDGSTSWASFLGANLQAERQPTSDASKAGRGDIIVLYDQRTSGYHTVIASGTTDPEAGTLVYSIAQDSKKTPWLWVFTPRPPQT